VKTPRSAIITKDKVNGVVKALNDLTGKQVLVGIPEANAAREDTDHEGPISNAALGYIHEFGAPGANIPARPFLIPGVRKATAGFMPHLRAAADAALKADSAKADRELVAAGLVAEASAKNEIHTGNFAPLKPSTIAARARGRGTASRREAEDRYMELVKAGVSPAAAQSEAGVRALVDTGQLAASITSIVRRK
jgi:hypothetical protein